MCMQMARDEGSEINFLHLENLAEPLLGCSLPLLWLFGHSNCNVRIDKYLKQQKNKHRDMKER